MNDKPVMVFNDVVKVYSLPSGDVTALDGISFKVERGEFISIMGPSGSGKSTLLNLMGCLDTPTSGDIYIGGTRTGDMSDKELTELRRDRIGFIFQYFNLFPLWVAVARALINDPDILLCDEPTGNLDSKTGAGIMELMSELNRKGTTIIMVTHDVNIAAYSKRTIRIADGRIVE